MKITKELLDKYEEHIVGIDFTEMALLNALRYGLVNGFLPEGNTMNDIHKSFRVSSVTGSGYLDMVYWCLLNESHVFWSVVRKYSEDSEYGVSDVDNANKKTSS